MSNYHANLAVAFVEGFATVTLFCAVAFFAIFVF